MSRPGPGRGGQQPPAWSRALTYFGFDAIPAERTVARWRGRWARADDADDEQYPQNEAVMPSRQTSEIAGHVAGGVVILAVALFVLFAANTASRIVTSSEASADASPASTPAQPTTVAPTSVQIIERSPVPFDVPPGRSAPLAKYPVPYAAVAPAVGRGPTLQTPKAVPPPQPSTAPAPTTTATTTTTTTTTKRQAPSSEAPATESPAEPPPSPAPPATVDARTVVAIPLPPPPPPSCTATWLVIKQFAGGFGVEAQVTAGPGGLSSWTVAWDKLPDHTLVGWYNASLSVNGSSVRASGTALAPAETTKFWVDITGSAIPARGTLDCQPY